MRSLDSFAATPANFPPGLKTAVAARRSGGTGTVQISCPVCKLTIRTCVELCFSPDPSSSPPEVVDQDRTIRFRLSGLKEKLKLPGNSHLCLVCHSRQSEDPEHWR